MPTICLVCPDATHEAAAAALCPAEALPPTWTRTVVAVDAAASGDIIAVPRGATYVHALVAAGRVVVAGHDANRPTRAEVAWRAGLVAVSARSAQGNEGATSQGPGLWCALDVSPLMPTSAQSWAVYAAALYIARAWHAYGTAEDAQASIVAAARAASQQPAWTEATGYGVLPAHALPPPGDLAATAALSWALYGSPAGASITPMTRAGRSGVRIVAGAGSNRMRARAVDGAPYAPGRLYRRPLYAENLSEGPASTGTAHIVSRVTDVPFRLLPGESVEATVWEMQSSNPASGYDPSMQLRAGLWTDVPGALLDVFVADAEVEAYQASGAPSLPVLAAPAPVAPFAVAATVLTSSSQRIAWSTLPDAAAPCVVSVDGVDVATGVTSPVVVGLAPGLHTVRVRLSTGETEEHSTVHVAAGPSYRPDAPVPSAERDGASVVVAWPDVPGAASYRVAVSEGVGVEASATVEPAESPLALEWPGVAEVSVVAIGPGGSESAPGLAYALPVAAAKAVPLW